MLITLIALIAPALAAADLSLAISAPSGVSVYQSGRYTVTVSNVGNQTSSATTLTIQLPVTATTPVYTMGTVGAKSGTCSTSGTKIICSIPTVRRARTTSVYFDLTLPESTNALVVSASIVDSNPSGNTASSTAALNNYSVSFAGGTLNNTHCTGTSLSSYYECTLFPSSISGHSAIFNGDNTITISGAPEYGGTWSRPTADSLEFNYTEYGVIVAEFEGYGVSSTCWEGMTTFPSSTYMSMYKVCQ